MADETFDVVIVGGGVSGGGLAAALAHVDTDARVLLVEQTARSGAINRGDLIWPPHVELLAAWGVLPEMERRGAVRVHYNEFYDNDGHLLLRHDYTYFGCQTTHAIALEHPEIEESLLAVAARHPNISVWQGAPFLGIAEQNGAGVTIQLRRDDQKVSVRAAWLIGADGRNSAVRKASGIESPLTPYPYEILMTRAPKLERWQDASAQFVGPRGWAGIFLIPGPYVRLALPFPSGSFTAFMKRPEAERTAAVVRRAGLLRDTPIDWGYVHNYKIFAHHAPTYQKGRVVLVGDAAHSFTPMLGMGMNVGLEDATALAPLLAHRARREALDKPALQREYEGRRRPRNQRVLTESTRQGNAQIAGGALTQAGFRFALRVGARYPKLLHAALRSLFR